MDQNGDSGWGVASSEHNLVLHDCKDLLVGNLSHVLRCHEAAGQRWQEVTEAGEELPAGFEVAEPHLVNLLGD